MSGHPTSRMDDEEQGFVPAPPIQDLPAGRHQFHREILMHTIDRETRTGDPVRARTRRPLARRLTFALPVAALAAAAVVATTVGLPVGGDQDGAGPGAIGSVRSGGPADGAPGAVPGRLNQMSLVAARSDVVAPRPDQWIYIRTRTIEFPEADRQKGQLRRDSERQIWQSLDGNRGWLIDSRLEIPEAGEPFADGEEAFLNAPSYHLLTGLPTDPEALLEKIYRETAGRGSSADQEAFVTVGDLFAESYSPTALNAALFKAAAGIPGVQVIDDVVDAAGRRGVAVARADSSTGTREELIFDRSDFSFLGRRTLQDANSADIRAGTVIQSTAVLTRAVVDRIRQVPGRTG